MKYEVKQQENGWTHIHWELSGGVNAKMIDWHWSNMDKTFILWHPSDHYGFEWYVPVTPERFIGAIHYTLQTRGGAQDMTMEQVREQGMGLAYLDVADLSREVSDLIVCEHCCLVGARKHGKVDPKFNSIRIHQWEDRGDKVVGISSAIMFDPEDLEFEKQRMVGWSKHAAMEIGRFETILPPLYELYQEVTNPKVNPFHDLRVTKTADGKTVFRQSLK